MGELAIREAEAPAVLAKLDAHRRAAEGAYSPETALRNDSALFSAWCAGRGVSALPASPETVAAFIDDQAKAKASATVSRYVASLNHMHRAADLPPPGLAEIVKLALKRMRRAKGTRQRQAAPLGFPRVRAILATLGDSLPELRDAALIAVAYDSLGRRSELAALDVSDIERAEDGSGTVLIRRSKTDQEGAGSVRYLSADTLRRLRAWLDAARIEDGALFIPLGPAARGERLSDKDVARIFKRRAEAAALAASAISGHSTRVGAAQDMLAHNLALPAIQQAGGWKSSAMPARYGAKLEARRSAAAQLAAIQGR